MNIIRSIPELLLSACLLTSAPALLAATATKPDPDTQKPLHIESDSLQVDRKKNLARYEGQVHVRQGRFELTADTLEVFTRQNKLQKLIARGQPARFRKYDYKNGKWVNGQANTIHYLIHPERQLILIDNASIRREPGEALSGARITYRIGSDTIEAQGRGKRRVHMILPPDTQEGAP